MCWRLFLLACAFHSITVLTHSVLPVTSSSLLNLTEPFFNPVAYLTYPLTQVFPLPDILFRRLISMSAFTSSVTICSSTSPNYASTQLTTCHWIWPDSGMYTVTHSLSFWDMLLSWYSSYFSNHSLSAAYAHTKVIDYPQGFGLTDLYHSWASDPCIIFYHLWNISMGSSGSPESSCLKVKLSSSLSCKFTSSLVVLILGIDNNKIICIPVLV